MPHTAPMRSIWAFLGDQHHAIVGAFASAFAAALAQNEKYSVLFCCFVGGCVAGLAGASLSHWLNGYMNTPELEKLTEKKRWLVNWTLAALISPALTQYVHAKYAQAIEIEAVALVCSLAVGVLGVPALCVLLPLVLKKTKKKDADKP